MGNFLCKLFEVEDANNKKKPLLAQALKESPFWDLINPLYVTEISGLMNDKWLKKINLAMQLLMNAINKETKKFKFGKSEECSLEARDFALIFK